MRMHIEMDEELVKRIDRVVGPKGRSKFVRQAVREALDQHERGRLLKSARGAIPDRGHDWDTDPSAWVRSQRRGDKRRVG